MTQRIIIIQGHPDSSVRHFGHALADAYAEAAAAAGHELRRIEVAAIDFPLLRSKLNWERDAPAAAIRDAQDAILWASHVVIFYPLWLGSMPALLKAFLEQTLRPGFAMSRPGARQSGGKMLKGRSARIVITMGMPAFLYRWYFGAHSLKSLTRNILGFLGIGPIRSSLIGLVEGNPDRRRRWLQKMGALGRDAA